MGIVYAQTLRMGCGFLHGSLVSALRVSNSSLHPAGLNWLLRSALSLRGVWSDVTAQS